MTALWVNLGGLMLIGLIVWWFWIAGSRSGTIVQMSRPLEIVVDDGVYTPARIEAVLGQPITLRFVRKDPSPCAEKVIFNGLDVSADLSVDKPFDMTLAPEEPGEFEFTCQMGMYRGKLVVK